MGSELTRPLSLIEAEINFLKVQTATGMIEIGKRLIEAKEMVPHGEWGKWLEEKVDFSERSARRFMQAASEFSNRPALTDLTPTKVFLLLDVPEEERQEFVDTHKLEEMTTRQVEAAVKEWKAKAEKAESNLQKANQIIQDKKDDIKFLQESMKEDREARDAEVNRLNNLLEEARSTGGDRDRVKELETELMEAKRQVEILTDEVMKPVEMEPAIVEKVPEKIEKELNDLRERVGQQVNPATVKFKVHFDGLVKGFQELLDTLSDITDKETREKYKGATVTLIDKMLERLQ